MTNDELNLIIEERIGLISKHLKILNEMKCFDGIEETQGILDSLYIDDFNFRMKYKSYDDGIKNKIDHTSRQLNKLESIKSQTKLQQKTSDFWSIINDFKSHLMKLHQALAYRVGVKRFLLEEPLD